MLTNPPEGTVNELRGSSIAVAVPMKLLEEKTTEIQAYESADLKTFQEGCRVIQLFQKAHDFMQMDGNQLEKIQLARAVLSNPTLINRTMQYRYKKPLDELMSLTERPIWWRRVAAYRTCVLQLSRPQMNEITITFAA